jgi:hypothetical protein
MTPELETIVQAEGLDRKRAKAIARDSRSQDGFNVEAEGPRFGGPWWLTIPTVRRMLADDADRHAMTWSMDPDGLERLALTLEWLYDELPDGLTFEATSVAEQPIEKLVSRAELLRIVRSGQIGTRERYRVPAAGDHPT